MVTASALASPTAQPERRYLTILFCDLVGYTNLSERLDPEELHAIQSEYQRLALAAMERYSGFVARLSGDGILVYFGYPAAHENDAERAVRAALELISRLAEFNATLRSQRQLELSVRIGIHTGLVIIGSEPVSGGWQRHSVVGEAANLAAHLQAEAVPNTIIVSHETFELVEGYFTYEPLGQIRIKGLSRIISAYRITEARRVTRRSDARLRRGATRMIGRTEALESIIWHWNDAIQNGRCRNVRVVGEGGVGKTRLVTEFRRQPELAEANVLQMQCQEIFANTPLYVLGSYLWSRLGLAIGDGEETRAQKVSEYLDTLGANTPQNAILIQSMLGLSPAGISEEVAPTPVHLRQKQFAFIISHLEQLARKRPTFLWIEDSHWLDPTSAELLSEIVGRLRNVPLFVLLTTRAFPTGPALPEPDEVIAIEPLGTRECLELARLVPGAQGLSEQMLARAVEGADGIPLFVEQLVLSLIDQDSTAFRSDRAQGGLPLVLTEMLSERLDRLPAGKRIVQAAACVGRSFTLEFLGTLLDEPSSDLVAPVEALVGAEILRARPSGADVRFEFRHVLLQRMAYESVLQSDRRVMHGRIVKALTESPGAGPPIPEVLAHHLTAAGNFPEAIKAWLMAGVSASRRSAHIEAIDHLRRGLGLLSEIADPNVRRQMELELQATLMGAFTATDGPTSQSLAACCERGLQLCKEGPPTPLIFPFLFGNFTLAMCKGQTHEAKSSAELFLSLANRNAYEPGRVIGHRLLGMALLSQGMAAQAKEQFERSLELYSHERDAAATHVFGQNTQVHSQALLSLTMFCLGDVDEALRVGLSSIRAADALRHPLSTSIALAYVGGWVFGLCGAADEMMMEARRMISVSEQHRLGPFPAFGSAFLGWALCQQGDLKQGIAVMEHAIDTLNELGFRLSVSGQIAILADAKRRSGDLAGAEKRYEEAMQMAAETDEHWLEPEIRRIGALIEYAIHPDNRDRAESMLREAVECARKLNFPVFELRCLDSLKQVLGPANQDPAIEARLAELSSLRHLDRRVASAMLI